jgi:hypothetical protein
VDARKAFINDWLEKKHDMPFGAICAAHGITRQLGYKWVERFEDGRSWIRFAAEALVRRFS